MIEAIVISYLLTVLEIPAFAEVPEVKPDRYILVQKTGSQRENRIDTATLAIQSIAPTLFEAAALNERVKAAITLLPEARAAVFRAALNSDYNFTDTETKERRYQAVFHITYKEDEHESYCC